MRQVWRWFGPNDRVTVEEVRQAGAQGVVAALLHIPPGEVWQPEAIAGLQQAAAHRSDGTPSGLTWEIVESLPVSEDIKKQSGDWRQHIDNYRQSLTNLAEAGLHDVVYNFMPLLDWTRTDVAWRLPHGGTCMRFDYVDFAIYDLHILKRAGAAESYAPEILADAEQRHAQITDTDLKRIADSVHFGLPGEAESLTTERVREGAGLYEALGEDRLRANLAAFLEEVVPHAERLGMRLACHPDDPPFSVLGMPRIVSSENDLKRLVGAVNLPANGLTLCSGSLGARGDNDLPGIMKRLGDRVHFLHLRNVRRETDARFGSFHESEHLDGNIDMVALIGAVLAEEKRRSAAGRADAVIPMRPDHGQDILDDLDRHAQPGYPAVGRLKGLAELRGVEAALARA